MKARKNDNNLENNNVWLLAKWTVQDANYKLEMSDQVEKFNYLESDR